MCSQRLCFSLASFSRLVGTREKREQGSDGRGIEEGYREREEENGEGTVRRDCFRVLAMIMS